MPISIEDPSNLSSLYFDTSKSRKLKPYLAVNAFEIRHLEGARGRGLVARQDLKSGTCLFVIPPTISTPFLKALKEVKREGGELNASTLEAASERVLLAEMKAALSTAKESSDAAIANSFLALEGNSSQNDIPSLECLLATENSRTMLEKDTDDNNLQQIIRRNAFGPDFFTYAAIVRNLPKRPHRVLGLYPLTDMMNHSCHPNTVRVFAGEYMVVHCASDIAKGEEITTSYVPPTFSYPQRQASLNQNHGFECTCDRCKVEVVFWQDNLGREANGLAVLQQQLSSGASATEAIDVLEKTILPSVKNSQLKHSIRLGFIPLYVSYLNHSLAMQSDSDKNLLLICFHLHLAFASWSPASTEHLSILHLAYELIGKIHSRPKNDQTQTLPKLQYWTEQVKQACLTRYGCLGDDLAEIRRIMQHTRLVLRNPEGIYRSDYQFI